MKKSWFAATLACAALAMPTMILADEMSGSNAMKHDAMAPDKMATMVCRKAAPGEKPSAMMMGDAKTAMVCKTVDPAMMMKKGSGPDLSHATSADQVDAAWRAYIQSLVQIPGGTGGG